MRILFVTHRFLPDYLAGTEVYTASLGKALSQRGHTVQIFTGHPTLTTPQTYTWDGLPVEAVPWGVLGGGAVSTFLAGFRNPRVEQCFKKLCQSFQPDIVHVQHLLGLSPHLLAIAHQAGARVILTLHDFWFMCSNTWLYRYTGELCPGPERGYHCGGCALQRLGQPPHGLALAGAAPIFRARTTVLRQALRFVHWFVAPSHLSANIFGSHGVPLERLTVLPSAILTRASTHTHLHAHQARPIRFIYLGAIIPPKGVHVIIAAFNQLKERSIELHIYGDMQADPQYTRLLRELPQPPGLAFKGIAARPDIDRILSEADVFLFPSLWYETYAIVVDEALNAGLPVLASAQTAAAERIQVGVNGLTAPAGDVAAWQAQMQRILEDSELLPRLRRGVRPSISLSQHVADIEALYTQVSVSEFN